MIANAQLCQFVTQPTGCRTGLPMKKGAKEKIELTAEDGERLVRRLNANQLSDQDRQLLSKIVPIFITVAFSLREARISLSRLRAIVFGPGNKKKKDRRDPKADDKNDPDDSNPPPGGGANNSAQTTPGGRSTPEGKPSKPGHGRYGADDYPGAQRQPLAHETLRAGDRCPNGPCGTLYRMDDRISVWIDGNTPLAATRYERERLRCSGCQETFTAALPESVGPGKYSSSAKIILALTRYQLGLPFHRLESFQAMLGVPLADATQYDLCHQVYSAVIPVFEALIYHAAQTPLIYHDDTGVRILSLMRENANAEAGERRGMFTTALVGRSDQYTVVLYFSGREHAGENLARVLALRGEHLPLPLVMSDAMAANLSGDLPEHIRCFCLEHGQRKVREIKDHFPLQAPPVLLSLGQVFDLDKALRERSIDGELRLRFHQRYSEPILSELRSWLQLQFDERQVEPNGSLGKAFRYLLNHWAELTRFVTVAGAPIDSNLVERALKMMIRQRRNSLFFASVHGATVASTLNSVIASCLENGVNAMDYLLAVVDHAAAVAADPQSWLPWRFAAIDQAT